jgi:endonuclease-3 related protein
MNSEAKDASRKLFEVYSLLRDHFGYHHPWWPGSPLEVTLTALLVQQCDWSAAWAGVGRLRAGGLLSLPALASVAPEEVQAAIRGVAFAPTKGRRLVGLARSLLGRGFREVEAYLAPDRATAALRHDLLSLAGVGQETADAILCFASDGHPSFVVDEYTRRAFRRLGAFPELGEGFWSQPYGRLKCFFEDHILAGLPLYDAFDFAPGVRRDVALFRDFHAQVVELGKHHCLRRNPCCAGRGRNGWKGYAFCESHCGPGECSGCPLRRRCHEGTNNGQSEGGIPGSRRRSRGPRR